MINAGAPNPLTTTLEERRTAMNSDHTTVYQPCCATYTDTNIIRLYRQIDILWDFIAGAGLWSEAMDYLEYMSDEDTSDPLLFL